MIVTSPGGDSPGGEGPTNLTDLSTGSKWLDFSKFTPVVFQFTAPVTIDTYNFATAGDAQDRDPVSWRFEGSANGSSWVLLDVRTNFTNRWSVPLSWGTFRAASRFLTNGLSLCYANRKDFGRGNTAGDGKFACEDTRKNRDNAI